MLKELGRLAERVTDVLDKVRFPTACRRDKER